jgi:hypothetical protein
MPPDEEVCDGIRFDVVGNSQALRGEVERAQFVPIFSR